MLLLTHLLIVPRFTFALLSCTRPRLHLVGVCVKRSFCVHFQSRGVFKREGELSIGITVSCWARRACVVEHSLNAAYEQMTGFCIFQ